MSTSNPKKFQSFSVGEKGQNRVRVFQEKERGYVFAEWREPQPEGEAKRKRVRLHCRNKQEARGMAWEIAIRLGQHLAGGTEEVQPEEETHPSERLTVGQLFHIYLSTVTPRKAETTQEFDRNCLAMWAEFLGPDTPAIEVGRRQWYAFREARESERIFPGKSSRGKPSPRTVRRDMTALRTVYNWAVDPQDDVPVFFQDNPLLGLSLPKERKPNRVQVSAKKVHLLLEAAPKVDWRLWVALVLAHETGHRIGSIRRLRWEDIHFTTGEIEWHWERDKEGNPHRTPMSPDARAAFEFTRGLVDESIPWVFPAPKDPAQAVRRDTLTNWLKKAEQKAGLPRVKGFGFHAFRRKMVNDLRDKVSVTQIAALGGWTSTHTIVQVYMLPDTDKLREVQALRPGLGIAPEGNEPSPEPTGQPRLRVIEGGLSEREGEARTDSKTDSKGARGA